MSCWQVLLMIACGQNQTVEMSEQVPNELENDQVAPKGNDKNSPEMVLNIKDENTLKLYISADRTGTEESGIAIEQGVVTALSEIENQLKVIQLKLWY